MTPQEHAQAVASSGVLKLGQSMLGVKLAGAIAPYDVCFLTYAQLRDLPEMKRPDGRPYHVESIGRKMRELANLQLVSHRRVMPGDKPRRAKKRAWNGTTENSLVWAAIQARSPLTRAERRRARIEHERQLGAVERERRRKEREAEIAFLKRLSGDISPAPAPTYRQSIDSIVADAMQAQDAHARARAARRARAHAAGDGAGQVPTPPPAATGPPE